jgi:low affinity Fe/Cu permease
MRRGSSGRARCPLRQPGLVAGPLLHHRGGVRGPDGVWCHPAGCIVRRPVAQVETLLAYLPTPIRKLEPAPVGQQRSRPLFGDVGVSGVKPSSSTSVRSRTGGSRALHRLERFSQSTAASSTTVAVSATFLLTALLAPHATPLLTAFEALAAAVTLVMVFALQHTQARQQAAVQRKLDEILQSLPGADKRLVLVESASEHELADLAVRHTQVRDDAVTAREEPGRYPRLAAPVRADGCRAFQGKSLTRAYVRESRTHRDPPRIGSEIKLTQRY